MDKNDKLNPTNNENSHLAFVITRNRQADATVRYHCTATRKVKIKKTDRCWQAMEKRPAAGYSSGVKDDASTLENRLGISQKVEFKFIMCSCNSLLGFCPQEWKTQFMFNLAQECS